MSVNSSGKRRLATVLGSVVLLIASVGAASPAVAATGVPAAAGTVVTDAVPPTDAPPIDTSDAVVAAEVARIEATGADIVGGSTTKYQAENGSAVASPQVYPSGCGLTVILYKSGLTIYSDNITSCAGAYATAEMDSWIGFYAWLTFDNEVASDTEYSAAASSFTMQYGYTCVNTNSTSFRTETYGELNYGGTNYTAAAYHEIDDTACGTS